MIVFVCHPYHRGGVTTWMQEAYMHLQKIKEPSAFVTVNPLKRFYGNNTPVMYELIVRGAGAGNIICKKVGYRFELGTLAYRAQVYAAMIQAHVPPGACLIPSDDEACWMACASLGNRYKVLGVLHSVGDNTYYDHLEKYFSSLSGIVCVSERVRKRALAELDGKTLHNTVVPCGINLDNYKAGTKLALIVWIGRLEEASKRVSDIVPIALALKAKGISYTIEVYGSGPEYEALEKSVGREGLDAEVKLMNWQSQAVLRNALERAKVLLQTSNYEGMSVVVMEALASGCRVVSTRVSGVEDIEHDVAAARVAGLYPVGDVGEAAQLLEESLAVEDRSGEAVTVAEKYYSIVTCMQKYKAFVAGINVPGVKYYIGAALTNSIQSLILSAFRFAKWKINR